jgi:hypothetical protein
MNLEATINPFIFNYNKSSQENFNLSRMNATDYDQIRQEVYYYVL